MVTKIYHDSDADLSVLAGKKIAVIGYGNQGRAQAMCLHDSGLDVTVGLRKSGKSWKIAQDDGLKVAEVPAAVKDADIVMILIPDEVQPAVYAEQIAPNLKAGAALEFAHGFAITFKFIAPPQNCDVIMVAPTSPGKMVLILPNFYCKKVTKYTVYSVVLLRSIQDVLNICILTSGCAT